jgi:hypothetical protein
MVSRDRTLGWGTLSCDFFILVKVIIVTDGHAMLPIRLFLLRNVLILLIICRHYRTTVRFCVAVGVDVCGEWSK